MGSPGKSGYSGGQLFPNENERMRGMCAPKSLHVLVAMSMDEFFWSYEKVWNMSQEEKRRAKTLIKEKNKIFRFLFVCIGIV